MMITGKKTVLMLLAAVIYLQFAGCSKHHSYHHDMNKHDIKENMKDGFHHLENEEEHHHDDDDDSGY